MKYQHKNNSTQGVLFLLSHETTLNNLFDGGNKENKLLTIAWNKGGNQKVVINESEVALQRNEIIPLMFYQNFRFENPEDIVAWQFNRDFYCIIDHDSEVGCVGFLFHNTTNATPILLDELTAPKFDSLLTVFIEEFNSNDNVQGEMLRILLVRLIIKLTRLAKKQYLAQTLTDDKFKVLREFNLLVENNFRKQHSVQFYARCLAKSPKTLSNLFAQYNHKSPLQVIHQRIEIEAKRLFFYSEKSVKEIAQDLGFENASHFSHFFKKQTGLNPTLFKSTLKRTI